MWRQEMQEDAATTVAASGGARLVTLRLQFVCKPQTAQRQKETRVSCGGFRTEGATVSLEIPPVHRRVPLLLLALAAALGGCQESGFDESKETARPLKVQHALGDIGGTKVPGQATRAPR